MKLNKKRIFQIIAIVIVGGFVSFAINTETVKGSWRFHQSKKNTDNSTVILEVHPQIQKPVLPLAPKIFGTPLQSQDVVVLMYHHVAELDNLSRQRDAIASDLTVSPDDFEAQVKYFHDHGYISVSFAQVYEAMIGLSALPKKSVAFTFDDGYRDVFVNAIPVLQKYGFKGSFAIAPELLGRPTYAVWVDVLAADRAGMEIVSHTQNHLDLTAKTYSEADLRREIFGSKETLQKFLGHPVDFLVYPYGHVNGHIQELAKEAGYYLAFTTKFGLVMDRLQPMNEPRVRVHGVDGVAKLRQVLSD